MSAEQWILLIQAIGLPLFGWAIRELRRFIKKIDQRFESLEKSQKEHEDRIVVLEAA